MLKVDFYDPASQPGLRYVRKAQGTNFYEWSTKSAVDVMREVAWGTCDASDLPHDIREACDRTEGMNSVFYASEWP